MVVTITCLYAISLSLFDEPFNFDHFKKKMGKKLELIKVKLSNILINLKGDINKCINDIMHNDNLNKKMLFGNLKLMNIPLIVNYLSLFSTLKNEFFYKDMLIFFNDKLLPLLNYMPDEIFYKIINLILCDFVREYKNDGNLSEYIFENIQERIFCLTFNENNLKRKLY